MDVQGSSVCIVGGSIGGCAAAIALERLGCKVTVLERAKRSAWEDEAGRGAGICAPRALVDGWMRAGFLPEDYETVSIDKRIWITRDPSEKDKVILEQDVGFSNPLAQDYSVLWKGLRSKVLESVNFRYETNVKSVKVLDDGQGVQVTTGNDEILTFDVVFGADGYKSTVRTAIFGQDLTPDFAGYICYRGNFPQDRISDPAILERFASQKEDSTVFYSPGYEKGHGVCYLIPDGHRGKSALQAKKRRVNWVLYAPPPAGDDFSHAHSIPPGAVTPEMYAELQNILQTFPSSVRPFFNSPIEEVSIQPVYDVISPSYVSPDNRLALLGDAGCVARPHTAAGSSKAIEDALALQNLGQLHKTWPALLGAYSAERAANGKSYVNVGRAIGESQVVNPPKWHTLDAESMIKFQKQALGKKHKTYLLKRGSSEMDPPAVVHHDSELSPATKVPRP